LAQADYFASRGLVTARADYRVKSRDGVTPDICTEDARSAIRWLKQNHKKLGIDPEKVIASGGSAGGHLAGTTMIPKSVEDAGDDLSISTVPAAMLLFNPVLNFNIKNDTRSIKERMGERGHLAEKISPTLHLSKNTPPAIVFFGTDDELKIHGDEYCKIAKKLGVRAEQFTAKGQGHGFFNKSPWLEKTMLAADKFLISLGLTQGKPTVKVPKDESRAQDQEAAKEKVDTQKTSLADQLEKRWQTMDANKDDKLSTDEAKGPFKNNFDKIDTNSDGFIDRSELAKVADRMTRK
jgi:dienelactone hydrolase